MLLFNIAKARLGNLTTAIVIQTTARQTGFNILGAVLPLQVPVCHPPCQSCIQKRFYNRKFSTPDLKPIDFSFSEDFRDQQKLDPEKLQFRYKDLPEVKDLPPHVRKLLTLEYASGRERLEHRHMVSQDKLTSVTGPTADYERQIVFLTVKIRNLIPYVQANRQNKKDKAHLYERIQMRKKILSYLRQVDYDRFLWLLKELKITYTMKTRHSTRKVSRRAKEKQEVKKQYIDELSRKLEAVKEKIELEKVAFLNERKKVLAEIDENVQKKIIEKEEVEKLYEEYLDGRKKVKEIKQQQPVYSSWKKLNDFIIKDKERKEREKWVF